MTRASDLVVSAPGRSTRKNDAQTCEIRRLFVRSEGRGGGLGRALADRLVDDAGLAGFSRLVLNTLPEMTEAIHLYESMGFQQCDPYVEEPLDGVLYFGVDLPTR